MDLLSKIYQFLSKDPALVLDANYEPNIFDRRYVDNQLQGIEQHLVDSLIQSKHATWYHAATGVSIGDVVCSAGVLSNDAFQWATLATPAALALSAQALGVVLVPAAINGMALVAIAGSIPSSVTQLLTLAGNVRVSSTGRCERVVTFGSSDFQLGVVDVGGVLTLAPSRQSSGGSATPTGVVWVSTKNTNGYVIGPTERAVGTDTTGGRFTIFMPPSPTANTDCVISDVTGSWDTNPLTIHGNGLNILGAPTYTAAGRWNSLWLSYNANAGIWVLI